MIIASIIFSSIYIGVCFYLSRGLKNISKSAVENFCGKSVSVIVCARNEENNIGKLLDCLSLQTYPKNLTQIIVVNDRSTDRTAQIALSYKNRFENFLLIDVRETQSKAAPKKFAFETGVRCAAGEIIVQTDADSIVAPDWIGRLTAPFCSGEVSLVQGIVKYSFEKPLPFWLKIYQEYDFLSHGIIAAAAIGKNIPLNANANNFAFCKEIYDTLNGYEKLNEATSGDDGLLMQKIWRSGKKIYFNTNSLVETQPEYSLKGLINQRKKWGAQTRFYLPKQTAILVLIFAFYCFILFSFSNWKIVPALIAVKILGELFFMRKGLQIFGEKKSLAHLIWISPINLFLTVYSVFSGIFGKFYWKGGKFGAKTK